MITAIDSSVLLCIFNDELDADAWMEVLVAARKEGRLVISEIVYAELSPGFAEQQALDQQLQVMGIQPTEGGAAAAWAAGKAFSRYRQAGGPRKHLIPDFLIAGHALARADRLAAVDRGYLRRWFQELTLLGIHPD